MSDQGNGRKREEGTSAPLGGGADPAAAARVTELTGNRGITEASGGVGTLTREDFVSDQEVRWCPGCGDYAILAAVQGVMPTLGIPREKTVFISGIGCSSRFPYYMNTYGIHGIHGRAPAIATGLAAARPDLSVWVVTGDGDGLSIGGNHLIHALRRNVNLRILLFNNQIYGLTKGQYSPTSERGKVTKSTPFGSLEHPFNPVSVALGAEASFVARSIDVERKHLPEMLRRAAAHRGSAFVEIYQNCNIFNDGAFLALTSKEGRSQNRIYLEHGKPIRFGPDGEKGVTMSKDGHVSIVDVAEVGEDKIVVHDEHRDDPSLAFALSRLADNPTGPTPIGVFRDVQRPAYGDGLEHQLRQAAEAQGPGDLSKLLDSGDSWTVG
jgi:2-oxoglutarate ferredoxin oxidoreductase subunit beta